MTAVVIPIRSTDPTECTCDTPDPDVIGECRHCRRVHISAERRRWLLEQRSLR